MAELSQWRQARRLSYVGGNHRGWRFQTGQPRPALSSVQTTCQFRSPSVCFAFMAVTVAIIEDDAATRGIVAGWIDETSQFRCVAQHGNVTSALAALPAQSPDVALVDINLPDLTGIECVRQLKPQLPNTQFVMVTVYGDSDHIFEALAAGASGYLLKRLTRENLLAALEEVYRGGSPMSSSIARKVVQCFQSPRPAAGELETLSPREQEVLHSLAEGYREQGNRRTPRSQRADRGDLHPAHLRKTARSFPRRRDRQVQLADPRQRP